MRVCSLSAHLRCLVVLYSLSAVVPFGCLGRANANVSPSACCPFNRIVELSLMKIIMVIISDG